MESERTGIESETCRKEKGCRDRGYFETNIYRLSLPVPPLGLIYVSAIYCLPTNLRCCSVCLALPFATFSPRVITLLSSTPDRNRRLQFLSVLSGRSSFLITLLASIGVSVLRFTFSFRPLQCRFTTGNTVNSQWQPITNENITLLPLPPTNTNTICVPSFPYQILRIRLTRSQKRGIGYKALTRMTVIIN